MGLLSSFQRAPGATPAPAGPEDPQAIEGARVRARRRLIGAVVLLGIGVIAFPLLFETQPRPIPVDIAIEIPRKDQVPPLALPPATRTAPAAASPSPPTSPTATAPTQTPAAGATPAAVVPTVASAASRVAAAEAPPAAPPAARTEARAEPKPDAAPPAAKAAPAAEAGGRYVVQVGAFADAAGARSARSKVEGLGLRTYTQAVETASGTRTRVRVGPFTAREEADQAAAKLKAAGMTVAVLTL